MITGRRSGPTRRGCRAFVAALGIALFAAGARDAGAQATSDVVVRTSAGTDRRVAVVSVETATGPRDFVRLEALATALGAQYVLRTGGARLEVGGATIDVRDGVQYVRVGGAQYPLIVAPVRDARGVLVPLQFALDLVPRVVRSYAYDPATRTLRPSRAATRVAARDPRSPAPSAVTTPNDESAAESPAVRLPSIPPRTQNATRTPSRNEPHAATEAPATDDRTSRPDAPVDAGSRPRRLVAIDAGHGGPDAGMRGTLADGTPLLEKDVTLGVARALRDALTERGIGVVMTRTTDTLIALGDRGRIANARHADLFVSVHVNAANPAWREPAAARGFETYFLSEARTEEARQVADRENASTRFEAASTSAGADPLRFVLSDLAQNAHLRESSRLAAAVQGRLARVHPGPNRRVHQAGFKVLVTAAMPAVLVEVGFGSNPDDAAYLASSRGRRELADAIASAVSDFLVRYVRSSAE